MPEKKKTSLGNVDYFIGKSCLFVCKKDLNLKAILLDYDFEFFYLTTEDSYEPKIMLNKEQVITIEICMEDDLFAVDEDAIMN